MDDLQMLGALLAKPDPSGDVVERGRYQLTKAMRGPVRQRRSARQHRTVWLTGGLGLTAAAATAAIVVASGAAAPTAPRGSVAAAGSSRTAAAQPSARQILLAAAAAAAAQAQPAGTYWHVKIIFPFPASAGPMPKGVVVNNTEEYWVGRDGKFWNTEPASCPGPPGTVIFESPNGDIPELALPDGYLTYEQAARLPTDPAALTAWMAKYDKTRSTVAGDLATLLWEAVPPEVRAAAFRALAAFPGAKNLGPVKGGQSLLIPFRDTEDPWMKLVVDSATSLVRSETNVKGSMVIEIGEWTNRLPRVIPVGPKSSCLPGH